jgi:large subunit ribosomal protein L1
MKRGKKYEKTVKDLDKTKTYSLEEGIEKVKQLSYSKFTGSLELHADIKLPKDKDPKSIKGSLSLPHSDGRDSGNTKVAVFTKDKQEEAKKAGADFFDFDKLVKDVKVGNIEFDVAIATPSVMSEIAILGKELGPRGLMPNPKLGTVTEDIATAVAEYKKGKQTFACDGSGVIHMKVGKLDMDTKELVENVHEAIKAIEVAVGRSYDQIINKVHLAPTMGHSVKINYTRE